MNGWNKPDGDLISRAEAIDDLHGKDPSQIWDTADIEVWVNALPSAQPEKRTENRTETRACDCISREAAIDALDEIESEVADGYGFQYEKWRVHFRVLPSAQPERKTGKWIYNSPVTMKCNQCGLVIKDWDWHRFKYCPNCGADMREVDDERPD